MFFDDYNKNKHTVNLGNKTLSSKDDFLKKIKEDERKEKDMKYSMKGDLK